MAEYPRGLVQEVSPLPESIDQSVLNERGLYVVQGLDVSLAEQLVERSKEDDVMFYCAGDSEQRFKDLPAIEAWQAKARLALPLVSRLGGDALRLEGLCWMGPGTPGEDEPEIPGARITYAQRVYKDAANAGNATPYARVMLDTHDALYDNDGVWLEAWVKNIKATKTYWNVGFEEVAVLDGELHGQPMKRIYMTLAR